MNWRNLLRILPISVLAREDLVQGSRVGPPARKEKPMPAEAATMNRAARPASALALRDRTRLSHHRALLAQAPLVTHEPPAPAYLAGNEATTAVPWGRAQEITSPRTRPVIAGEVVESLKLLAASRGSVTSSS